MNMRLLALMLVVPTVMVAKAQSERRMTVDDLFQLVESNSKTLQETKISVEFAQKGIEAARSQRLPDVNATLSASYKGNGVAESLCSGLYSYGLRRQIADALSRGIHGDYSQVLMVAVKEMFGLMCIIGTLTLLFMLLYDVQPVRSTMRRMMPLRKIGQMIRRESLRVSRV